MFIDNKSTTSFMRSLLILKFQNIFTCVLDDGFQVAVLDLGADM